MNFEGKTIYFISNLSRMIMMMKGALKRDGTKVIIYEDLKFMEDHLKDDVPDAVVYRIHGNIEQHFKEIAKLFKLLNPVRIPLLVITKYYNDQVIDKLHKMGIETVLREHKNTQKELVEKLKAQFISREDIPQYVLRPQGVKAEIIVEAQLLKMGETCCEILGPVTFNEESKVKVKSEFLEKMGIEYANLSLVGHSHYLSSGKYDTGLMFLGINQDSIRTIRKEKMKWGGI